MSFRTFKSFEDLVVDYESGELHPADLKPALAKALNRILQVKFDISLYPKILICIIIYSFSDVGICLLCGEAVEIAFL